MKYVETWSETVDVNNDFNPTTGTFTAPRTGLYIFNFSFSTTGVDFNDNSVLECQMVCSNSAKTVKTIMSYPVSTPGSNTLDIGGQVSVVVNLTASETIRPAIYHNVAATIQLKADSDFNHLSIVEL